MQKELTEQLDVLLKHGETVKTLVDQVNITLRNNGDVSFVAMESCKAALANLANVRKAIEGTNRILKARAIARMREM